MHRHLNITPPMLHISCSNVLLPILAVHTNKYSIFAYSQRHHPICGLLIVNQLLDCLVDQPDIPFCSNKLIEPLNLRSQILTFPPLFFIQIHSYTDTLNMVSSARSVIGRLTANGLSGCSGSRLRSGSGRRGRRLAGLGLNHGLNRL